jgi:hypothetical protein
MRDTNTQVADLLRDRNADVSHLKLEEHGIRGNGHMMMFEKNSDAVAGLILDWLHSKI